MAVEFDRSPEAWPYKADPAQPVPLEVCFMSVGPAAALRAINRFNDAAFVLGSEIASHPEFGNKALQGGLREEFAKLLNTHPGNISIKENTDRGLVDIALGYPFAPGDQVLTYAFDYSSVSMPFLARVKDQVEIVQVDGNRGDRGTALGCTNEQLESAVTRRTAMIVVSDIHFISGNGIDIERLASFCKDRNIKLVLDVAQSIGKRPIDVEKLGVDAVVFPVWKGLMGPRGCGALFTAPEFRALLRVTQIGGDVKDMQHFTDYGAPNFKDGRKFEPSTKPTGIYPHALTSIRETFGRYTVPAIGAEVDRFHGIILNFIDSGKAVLVTDTKRPTGFILSFALPQHVGQEEAVASEIRRRGVRVTVRDRLLRIAPHFYNSETEIARALSVINDVLNGR